jgi:DNA-binding Xre family transcriptional regulator
MDIKTQLKERKMLKRELADEMGITMPTLKKKLDEPRHLTIGEVEKLRQLGFIINV